MDEFFGLLTFVGIVAILGITLTALEGSKPCNFTFGQELRVSGGFYKGALGFAHECTQRNGFDNRYTLMIPLGQEKLSVEVAEKDLEARK